MNIRRILAWIICGIILFVDFGSCQIEHREGCTALIDYVIGVDSSDSISKENYGIFKYSLSDLIDRLDIGQDRGKMGIVVYSTRITLTVPLSTNKDLLRLQALKLPHKREGTNTAKAIEVMRHLLIKEPGDVPKVGILLTDGISKKPEETALQAKLTRDSGVTMYSVGISEFAKMDELLAIAGSKDRVLNVSSYQELAKSINKLVKLVCPTTTTTTTTTTTPKPTTTTTTTTTTPVPETTPPTKATITTKQTNMTTTPIPVPKTTPTTKGICDDCAFYQGVCYKAHPEECALYIECRHKGYGLVKFRFRKCAFGQFWNQLTRSCRPASQCTCPNDKCRTYGVITYADKYSRNSRGYWKCVHHKSVPRCCPLGHKYIPSSGCVKDRSHSPKSFNQCPLHTYKQSICRTKRYRGCKVKYLLYVHGIGWTGPHVCQHGSIYDSKHCGCKYSHDYHRKRKVCTRELYIPFDVDTSDKSGRNVLIQNFGVQIRDGMGYFDGHSKLVIPQLPILNTYSELIIQARYLEIERRDRNVRTLFSNSDCNKCRYPSPSTMSVFTTGDVVHFKAKTTASETQIELPSQNWNHVKYRHDHIYLYGDVNHSKSRKYSPGRIINNNAPLQIGYDYEFTDNFKGYIDEFIVSSCRYEIMY